MVIGDSDSIMVSWQVVPRPLVGDHQDGIGSAM